MLDSVWSFWSLYCCDIGMCGNDRYHMAQSIYVYAMITRSLNDSESLSAVCIVELSTLLSMVLLSVYVNYTYATNTAVHYVVLV